MKIEYLATAFFYKRISPGFDFKYLKIEQNKKDQIIKKTLELVFLSFWNKRR